MKNLKIAFIALLSVLTINLKAQDKRNKVGFGFNINQVQNDFGLGIDIVSPYFSNSIIAVKVGGNFVWLEYFKNDKTTWTPYQTMQIGIRSRQFIIEDRLFIYGEAGNVVLFPNSKFSTQSIKFGGYGLFGFEFKPSDKLGFYFEMGGVGTGATADKITTNLFKWIYNQSWFQNNIIKNRIQ